MTAPTGFLVDRNNDRMKIGVAVDAGTGTPTMVTRDGNGSEILTPFGGGGSFALLSDKATVDIPSINGPTGTALGNRVLISAVGAANGVAGLDSGGKVPTSQLPASVVGAMNYQGVWNASTNSPTLTSGTGTKGFLYTVSVAGTTSLDGINVWAVGDHAVFNGTAWEKIDGSDSTKAGLTQVHALPINVPGTVSDGRLMKFRACWAGTITDMYGLADAGTTVMTIKKNGSATGSTVTAATTEAHSAESVTFADGDYIEVTASSSSACSGLVGTIKVSRTFAP